MTAHCESHNLPLGHIIIAKLNFCLSISVLFGLNLSSIAHSWDFDGEKVAADCLYNKELADALAERCLTAWARGAAVLVADSQVMVIVR
jgi:hypothetical protein